MSETRLIYMSFCDAERPEGTQFLGACVVEVDSSAADAEMPFVLMRRVEAGTWDGSPPEPEALFVAAAVRRAHELGCNPGGEVALVDLSALGDEPLLERVRASGKLGQLLSAEEAETIGS